MPNSLKCRLKKLAKEGLLSEKDLNRIVIIPDNATNGEVFLNVFKGSKEIGRDNWNQIGVSMCDGYDRYFNLEWWNAPYKKGEQE